MMEHPSHAGRGMWSAFVSGVERLQSGARVGLTVDTALDEALQEWLDEQEALYFEG